MGDALIKVNDEKMQKDDQFVLDDWIVVKGPSGGYIGKYRPDAFADTKEGRESWKEEVLNKISQGDVLMLDPVFEFVAPLRMVQDPRGSKEMIFTRDPIVVSVDFIVFGAPLYVKATSVYFGADMQGKDRLTYKGFVEQAMHAVLRNRAANHGLELVHDLGNLKKGPPPRA